MKCGLEFHVPMTTLAKTSKAASAYSSSTPPNISLALNLQLSNLIRNTLNMGVILRS
jgi:hypothetical protein